MTKRILAASGMMMLLLAGNLAYGGAEFYAPYNDCMTKCQETVSNCSENIRSNAADKDERESGCTNTNADCVQECQYLSMPPVEVVPPPQAYTPQQEAVPHQQEAVPPKAE